MHAPFSASSRLSRPGNTSSPRPTGSNAMNTIMFGMENEKFPTSDHSRGLVKDLYSSEDETCLSGLMCLLRAQLQVFAATSADVSDRSSKKVKAPVAATSSATGAPVNSPVPITPGRVGIRCKHCAHLPRNGKGKGAVSYPNSIRIMNQAVRNWQRYHFNVCQEIPQSVRDQYDELKAGKRVHSSKASQEYWPNSCYKLGLIDGPNGGIFFKSDPDALRLYQEAADAQHAAQSLAGAVHVVPVKAQLKGASNASKPKKKKQTKKAAKADAVSTSLSLSVPNTPNTPFAKAIDDALDLNFELDDSNLDDELEAWMKGDVGDTSSRRRSLNRSSFSKDPISQGLPNVFEQDMALSSSSNGVNHHQQSLALVSASHQPLHLANTMSTSIVPAQQPNLNQSNIDITGIDASFAANMASMGGFADSIYGNNIQCNSNGHEPQLVKATGQTSEALVTKEMPTHASVSNDRVIQLVRYAYEAVRATREMSCIPLPESKEDENTILFELGKELYELFADRKPFEDATTVNSTNNKQDSSVEPSRKRRELSSAKRGSGYIPLLDLGFPTSVCNLVSNLLDIDPTPANDGRDGRKLYHSVQELEEDLYQMMTDPDRYLHDPELAALTGHLDIGFGTRLYGQDANIKKLFLAFDRVAMNSKANALASCEMILVAGRSGVGKSSLIRHVQGPMIEKGACFISGKFDEKRKGQPLSAIVDSLEQFCNLLLTESSDSIESIRDGIQLAIGDDASILTALVPGLIKVIGEPKGTPSFSLGSKEAHQRLIFLFGRLLGSIARPSRPLVLFLDDLQWADEISLELMRFFVCDSFLTSILILGCYRENEVVEGHPLKEQLDRLAVSGASVGTLRISNMTEESINMLVSDALHMSPRLTQSLASVIFRKTDGNGLFVVQLLKSLCDEGLLSFSLMSRQWEWDVDTIKAKGVADDVIGLLAMKMLKLDATALWALKIASCLGSQCDDVTIRYLGTENEACVGGMASLLDAAVNEGLMFKTGSTYCFSHDEIQNAAYCLIPEAEQKSVHLQIGKALCTRVPRDELDTVLFIAVDQLFRGADVITSRDEIIHLCHLALRAGDTAIDAAAFLPASLYLLQAIGLLEESDWTNHYDLTLQLYSAAAEACYVLGNFEVLNELSKECLLKASCLQDKIRVYFSLTSSLSSQGKMLDAIHFGLGVLEQVGETFPSNLDDDSVIGEYVMKTSMMLQETNLESICEKEIMQDESKKIAMQFLSIMAMHSYVARPGLCPVVGSRMVQLTLEYGLCRESAFAFTIFGAVLCRSPEGVMQGYRLGKLALSLMETSNSKGYLARIYLAYGTINCFVEPLQACEESHKFAYETGMSTGDVEFACANISCFATVGIQSGTDLESLATQLGAYANKMMEMNTRSFLAAIQVYESFARSLMGETENDPTELYIEGHSALSDIRETQSKNALGHYYFARMVLCYIYQRYDLAAEMADLCRKAATLLRNARLVNEIFYMGLIALASAADDDEKKVESRDAAAAALQSLEGWLVTSQWNFLHKVKFLKAEIAVSDGNFDDAGQLYDEAIDLAGEHRFIHEQALACERCGMFHGASGNPEIAAKYMTRAIDCYVQWGAKRKAALLLERLNEGV